MRLLGFFWLPVLSFASITAHRILIQTVRRWVDVQETGRWVQVLTPDRRVDWVEETD